MTATTHPGNMTGLVLTAGGARGAYHAGVLKRISEIPALQGKPSPFKIITGASAGAINGAAMATHSANMSLGSKLLVRLWSNLKFSQVMRYDPAALAHTGLQAMIDFSLGGIIGAGRLQSFVDATPLRHFLESHLDFAGINESIQRGHLYALGVTATGYHSGKAFTFIQGQDGHPLWNKSRRVALKTSLHIDHILASAAIPLVFQPVPLVCLDLAGNAALCADLGQQTFRRDGVAAVGAGAVGAGLDTQQGGIDVAQFGQFVAEQGNFRVTEHIGFGPIADFFQIVHQRKVGFVATMETGADIGKNAFSAGKQQRFCLPGIGRAGRCHVESPW